MSDRLSRPRRAPQTSTRTTRDARTGVFERLEDHASRYPDLTIQPPDTSGLDARDAALATAILGAATRRWITLRWLLARHTRGPFERLEPAIQAALLGGAAQIVVLDRIPVHAAVSTAVQWAKARRGPRAAGLVNAVLRRIADDLNPHGPIDRIERCEDPTLQIPLDDGGALAVDPSVLPDDAVERLGLLTGLPAWLVERWWTRLGASRCGALAIHSLAMPPTILNVEHAESELPEELEPHSIPGHAVLTKRDRVGRVLDSRSDLWVQDPGAAETVRSVTDLSPMLVVDLCAGLGTKTRQLVRTFPSAQIVATDRDPDRLGVLASVFDADPRVETPPHTEVLERWAGQADLVVADVPCSNTGVLARRAEARHRASYSQLAELAEIQRGIIGSAVHLLTPSGCILYATCSMEREENEEQATWAAERFGLAVSRSSRRWPTGGPGRPSIEHSDGGYSVLLGPARSS